MDADRPVKTIADDRLGFAPVAQHLARVILDQSAKDGLVFGIEGKWGAGKSTLINLAIGALRDATPPPEIIEYSPWLVGSRDDLLTHLFDELAAAAVKIDPVNSEEIATPVNWRERITMFWRGDDYCRLKRKERLKQQLGNKLRAFGAIAGGLSKLFKSSAALGVPYMETAGTIVERAGEGAKSLFSSASITKRKNEIVNALKLLSRRIVVFVDDLDRLEPREASEVLRLIRAVADFPNVIYVLSYDVDVVSQTLQKAIQVDDGHAFLEKIVQVSFKVPRPEAFDLRRWFQDEVRALFAEEIAQASTLQRPVMQRLARAIDVQGGRYLTTPRDVVRVLNSLRLHAIPVRAQVDVADMVWLQLIRIGNPAFYAWIEEYLTETSAIYRGADVSGHVAAQKGQLLNDILAAENLDIDFSRFELSTILPGVVREFANQNGELNRVFNNLGREVFNPFIVERRLGSPEHYRYSQNIWDCSRWRLLDGRDESLDHEFGHYASLRACFATEVLKQTDRCNLASASVWLHMASAVPFVIGIFTMILLWVRDNIPTKLDWQWIKHGGGFLERDGENPPAKKFNAGQKIVFWGVVIGGLAALSTGLLLMFPFFWLDYSGMQWAQLTHAMIGLLMIALIFGHIYIGTIGMEGAIDAMWSGRVDSNWAKEHHKIWWEKKNQERDQTPKAIQLDPNSSKVAKNSMRVRPNPQVSTNEA